jgi:hypothetical protein
MKDKYAYNIYSPTNSHTPRPHFSNGIPDGASFTSVYAVTEDTAHAIVEAGTTAGFAGVVWSERLWLDIDSYEKAEVVENRLIEMELDYVAYNTGGRGGHFGILRDNPPSHLLPAQDKSWAKKYFPEADTSLYTHLHLFRLPGARHEKSGNYKRLVSEQRGKVLTLPPLERKGNGSDLVRTNNDGVARSVFRCFRVMSQSITTSPGDRHPTFVRLVNALKDDANVPPNIARWWLGEVNKLSSDPKGPEELDQVINSIYFGRF